MPAIRTPAAVWPASVRDAKSLAMWVERCEPLSALGVPDVSRERRCLQTSPEQPRATKDKKHKKDKKLEFPPPGGSGAFR